jgi:signal transduction histidine kinase
MQARLLVRVTAPIMAISIVPLLVGVGTAWSVHRSQESASKALATNVASMRAAEELAIGIRDIRFQLDRYLLTGDRRNLDEVPALRRETDPWLAAARQAAVTPREKELIDRATRGYDDFFREFDHITRQPEPGRFADRIRELIVRPLSQDILVPAQDYLDFNELEIERSNEDNRRTADQMVRGLLLLGVCGPLSGLLAGYGLARAVSRSIVRLSVPVRDAAGKLNEIVGPITVSARLSLEELEGVLHRIADEVGAVVERLQQSQREVVHAERLAAIGRLAAGIAHELRNPLTSMKLLVQAAADTAPEPLLQGRDLTVLEDEITRLEGMIQAFLDFARPPRLEKRAVALGPVLGQAVGLVSGRAERQGARVECATPPQPVVIEADPGQVRQVLLNLLLNALDAVPSGGTVRAELQTRPDQSAIIRVADTGPGLPAELRDQIFEPFVSTKETGVGLGLSICKRIVEAHGGTIAAADRPGGGAVFTVRLPLSRPAEGAGTAFASEGGRPAPGAAEP